MRNPARRSRNIGTAKQGHGQNNRLVIPTRNHPDYRNFVVNLGVCSSARITVGENDLRFLVEKPREGCAHACSVEDIVRVLQLIHPNDLSLLDFVILRQPKRKEALLNGAWGRYYPGVFMGDSLVSAIFLEAQEIEKTLRWEKPLSDYGVARLERLQLQGHAVVEMPRHFEIFSPLEAVRKTQLYETLPHEVGHHVHCMTDEDFWQRTKREREEFAEKYAREFLEKWGSQLK